MLRIAVVVLAVAGGFARVAQPAAAAGCTTSTQTSAVTNAGQWTAPQYGGGQAAAGFDGGDTGSHTVPFGTVPSGANWVGNDWWVSFSGEEAAPDDSGVRFTAGWPDGGGQQGSWVMQNVYAGNDGQTGARIWQSDPVTFHNSGRSTWQGQTLQAEALPMNQSDDNDGTTETPNSTDYGTTEYLQTEVDYTLTSTQCPDGGTPPSTTTSGAAPAQQSSGGIVLAADPTALPVGSVSVLNATDSSTTDIEIDRVDGAALDMQRICDTASTCSAQVSEPQGTYQFVALDDLGRTSNTVSVTWTPGSGAAPAGAGCGNCPPPPPPPPPGPTVTVVASPTSLETGESASVSYSASDARVRTVNVYLDGAFYCGGGVAATGAMPSGTCGAFSEPLAGTHTFTASGVDRSGGAVPGNSVDVTWYGVGVTLTGAPADLALGGVTTLTAHAMGTASFSSWTMEVRYASAPYPEGNGYPPGGLAAAQQQWMASATRVGPPCQQQSTCTWTDSSPSPADRDYTAFIAASSPGQPAVSAASTPPVGVSWRPDPGVMLRADSTSLMAGDTVHLTATPYSPASPTDTVVIADSTGRVLSRCAASASSCPASDTSATASTRVYTGSLVAASTGQPYGYQDQQTVWWRAVPSVNLVTSGFAPVGGVAGFDITGANPTHPDDGLEIWQLDDNGNMGFGVDATCGGPSCHATLREGWDPSRGGPANRTLRYVAAWYVPGPSDQCEYSGTCHSPDTGPPGNEYAESAVVDVTWFGATIAANPTAPLVGTSTRVDAAADPLPPRSSLSIAVAPAQQSTTTSLAPLGPTTCAADTNPCSANYTRSSADSWTFQVVVRDGAGNVTLSGPTVTVAWANPATGGPGVTLAASPTAVAVNASSRLTATVVQPPLAAAGVEYDLFINQLADPNAPDAYLAWTYCAGAPGGPAPTSCALDVSHASPGNATFVSHLTERGAPCNGGGFEGECLLATSNESVVTWTGPPPPASPPPTISLTANPTSPSAGSASSLVATASSARTPSWRIDITEPSSGAVVGSCNDELSCTIGVSSATPSTRTFVARLLDDPSGGGAGETSNQVSVTWTAAPSISLAGDAAFHHLGDPLTLTATAAAPRSPTFTIVVHQTSGFVVGTCTASPCTTTAPSPHDPATVSYVADLHDDPAGGGTFEVSAPVPATWYTTTISASTTAPGAGQGVTLTATATALPPGFALEIVPSSSAPDAEPPLMPNACGAGQRQCVANEVRQAPSTWSFAPTIVDAAGQVDMTGTPVTVTWSAPPPTTSTTSTTSTTAPPPTTAAPPATTSTSTTVPSGPPPSGGAPQPTFPT